MVLRRERGFKKIRAVVKKKPKNTHKAATCALHMKFTHALSLLSTTLSIFLTPIYDLLL